MYAFLKVPSSNESSCGLSDAWDGIPRKVHWCQSPMYQTSDGSNIPINKTSKQQVPINKLFGGTMAMFCKRIVPLKAVNLIRRVYLRLKVLKLVSVRSCFLGFNLAGMFFFLEPKLPFVVSFQDSFLGKGIRYTIDVRSFVQGISI